MSLLLDEEHEAETLNHKWITKSFSAIQLCLEQHLSISRESERKSDKSMEGMLEEREKERKKGSREGSFCFA